MNGLQLGNDEDVDVGSRYAIFKVKSHGLAYVLVEFVDGFSLREDIFADSPRTPKFTVVIDFHFYQHKPILYRLSPETMLHFDAKSSRGMRAKRSVRRMTHRATKATNARTA
jgi:hypothetical protein